MKKVILKLASAAMAALFVLFAFGCNIPIVNIGQSSGSNGDSSDGTSSGGSSGGNIDGHVHTYELVEAKESTCTEIGNYEYYVCGCGQKFMLEDGVYEAVSDAYVVQKKKSHTWSDKIEEIASTCDKAGVAEHWTCLSCKGVFVKKNNVFTQVDEDELALAKLVHKYEYKVQRDEYLVSEATETAPKTYRMSCVCGGTHESAGTFTVGEKLTEYKNANEADYTPTSVSVSLYDAQNTIYGFTYNTAKFTAGATIYYAEGNMLDTSNCQKYTAHTEEASTFVRGTTDTSLTYYITKAELALKPATTYTYCIGDAYVGEETFTEHVTFTTVNPAKTTFKFAHVSDSQAGDGETETGENTASYYANVLKSVIDDGNDFVVHTGDVVENSKYESFWTGMLHENFGYLSKIPVMAISGNHETTYYNGSNETYKHFNYLMPDQANTNTGLYYSFSYGDVKFIMLNANRNLTSALDDEQLAWLKKELKNKTEKWTIVAMHNPLYSVGKWGSNPERNEIARALQSQLKGLFAEYGVDLVLQGHDHCVSRTYPVKADGTVSTETFNTVEGVNYSVNPDGVIYLMNGPAGPQSGSYYVYTDNKDVADGYKDRYSYYRYGKTSSWAEIELTENRLTVSVKYYEGGVKSYGSDYVWGIEKAEQAGA